MGGAHSRRKGHQAERDLAIALRSVYPDARRQLEYHEADCHGVDIQNTGPYRFQCKKLKRYASINMIKEVQCARELGEVPVLVTAADNEEWMAVLPFSELVRLLERAKCRESK